MVLLEPDLLLGGYRVWENERGALLEAEIVLERRKYRVGQRSADSRWGVPEKFELRVQLRTNRRNLADWRVGGGMMSLGEGEQMDGLTDWERRSPACSLGYQTSPVTGAVEKRFQRLFILSSGPVFYSPLGQYPAHRFIPTTLRCPAFFHYL